MADVSVLDVYLYGEPIGTLTRVAGDRTLFAFDEAYIADAQRPVLSLGFKDAFGVRIPLKLDTQSTVNWTLSPPKLDSRSVATRGFFFTPDLQVQSNLFCFF